ncbi:ABC transporter permease [Olsenella sp. An290]|uniref:ABC transporter permease n=1 Tax=Olsenella sp. An290 TaxID=1965625 RepID=UPI00117CA589|nr:ABC transporter permease [Olsenella sp. An290]
MEKGLAPFHANVFTRFTLRSLRANRVRTTVTIVGVALACGLLMAVLASVTSLRAGLLERSRSLDGVWQMSFDYTDDATIGNLETLAGCHLDRLATRQDLGAAALSTDNSVYSGPYLGVLSLPQEDLSLPRAAGDTAHAVVPSPSVEEGRLPEKPGEIALPAYLKGVELTDGPTELEGIATSATSEGELELGSTVTLAAGRRTWLDGHPEPVSSGDPLQIDYAYETDASGNVTSETTTPLETLSDLGAPRAFTVVGFVYRTNNTLLTYQGLAPSRQIFDSLAQMALVLAVVIVVAAVSLIGNAFTISISERTRQFGLLSSLGASRRQLRRTVYTEAALLGAVGIPLGLAIGLAATAAVFAVTAEGWSLMLGDDIAVGLVVAPLDLAVAAGLTAVTLLISAFVPALRASRVSAVDAIRQTQDVRPSRRLRRLFRRRRTAMDDFSADGRRPRGLAARIGGMPVFLARRTLAVTASKSRVAAAALAVSVALLVTAGPLSDYLTGTVGYMDYGNADLMMHLSSQDYSSSNIAEDPVASDLDGIASDIAGVAGVREGSVSGVARATASIRLGENDVNWRGIDTFNERTNRYGGFQLDRQGYGQAVVELVNDGTWRHLADTLGLSGAQADPTSLSCVAFNLVSATNADTYGSISPLTGTAGSVDVLLKPEGLTNDEWLGMGDDGRYSLRRADETSGGVVDVAPASELGLRSVSVPVAAYATDLGDDFPIGSAQLADTTSVTLVMPMSAVEGAGLTDALWLSLTEFYAGFAEGADEEEVISGIQDVLAERGDIGTSQVVNLRESLREYRAMTFTVNVFLYCFIAITMAIAVANVFNTIASGLMLRTREFATLQSVGMGRRAFRRMIFLECADFACKGLVGGVALAALVNWGFFTALSSSISTLSLDMPWGHVALAFAVVVVVLAASTGYALHKTHALNLVEALRADAL